MIYFVGLPTVKGPLNKDNYCHQAVHEALIIITLWNCFSNDYYNRYIAS